MYLSIFFQNIHFAIALFERGEKHVVVVFWLTEPGCDEHNEIEHNDSKMAHANLQSAARLVGQPIVKKFQDKQSKNTSPWLNRNNGDCKRWLLVQHEQRKQNW